MPRICGRRNSALHRSIAGSANQLLKMRIRFFEKLLAALLIGLLAGCVSRSKSQVRQYEAYMAGQRQATASQQNPTVTFVGDVKNHTVPWEENLTLAKALLSAGYEALWDPHQISITRGGQTYKIPVKAFLAGGEDPPLEPGDVVEVKR